MKIELRALTICQPWAWAIVHGPKRWENRPQNYRWRGPLVIHAGVSRSWLAAGRVQLERLGVEVPRDEDLVFGAAIGLAELTDCRPIADVPHYEPFASGPFCLRLDDPRPLAAPLFCRGKLGLWIPPPAVLAQLAAG